MTQIDAGTDTSWYLSNRIGIGENTAVNDVYEVDSLNTLSLDKFTSDEVKTVNKYKKIPWLENIEASVSNPISCFLIKWELFDSIDSYKRALIKDLEFKNIEEQTDQDLKEKYNNLLKIFNDGDNKYELMGILWEDEYNELNQKLTEHIVKTRNSYDWLLSNMASQQSINNLINWADLEKNPDIDLVIDYNDLYNLCKDNKKDVVSSIWETKFNNIFQKLSKKYKKYSDKIDNDVEHSYVCYVNNGAVYVAEPKIVRKTMDGIWEKNKPVHFTKIDDLDNQTIRYYMEEDKKLPYLVTKKHNKIIKTPLLLAEDLTTATKLADSQKEVKANLRKTTKTIAGDVSIIARNIIEVTNTVSAVARTASQVVATIDQINARKNKTKINELNADVERQKLSIDMLNGRKTYYSSRVENGSIDDWFNKAQKDETWWLWEWQLDSSWEVKYESDNSSSESSDTSTLTNTLKNEIINDEILKQYFTENDLSILTSDIEKSWWQTNYIINNLIQAIDIKINIIDKDIIEKNKEIADLSWWNMPRQTWWNDNHSGWQHWWNEQNNKIETFWW